MDLHLNKSILIPVDTSTNAELVTYSVDHDEILRSVGSNLDVRKRPYYFHTEYRFVIDLVFGKVV